MIFVTYIILLIALLDIKTCRFGPGVIIPQSRMAQYPNLFMRLFLIFVPNLVFLSKLLCIFQTSHPTIPHSKSY